MRHYGSPFPTFQFDLSTHRLPNDADREKKRGLHEVRRLAVRQQHPRVLDAARVGADNAQPRLRRHRSLRGGAADGEYERDGS